MKAQVLVLSFSTLTDDPRVSRQIAALAGAHYVVSCGYGKAPPGADEHIAAQPSRRSLPQKLVAAAHLKAGNGEAYYWGQRVVQSVAVALEKRRFELVIANDLDALPVGLRIAKGAPVLFDAHEYAPLEYEDRWFWRFFYGAYREEFSRRYIPRAAAHMTVCRGIAEMYAERMGVEAEVLTNAARHREIPVRPTAPDRVRMVHHGAAVASRRTELMIELMDYLDDRFTLDLYLVPGDAAYIERLRRRGAGNPRVRFLDPVPMERLVDVSAGYDVGVFLLPPTNFNYRMALPNKFFEFLQARLAIAIGPSPEMARLVREYRCGTVAADFAPASLARILRGLQPDEIDAMKRGADAAAKVLNAEVNEKRFLAMVSRLLA